MSIMFYPTFIDGRWCSTADEKSFRVQYPATGECIVHVPDMGMVGVNDSAISSEVASFGGVKQSGFGREGSRSGLAGYNLTKNICMGD